MAENKGIQFFPIALFASVMGIAGVSISFRLLESIYEITNLGSTLLMILASIMFLVNAFILIYRVVKHPTEVTKDFNHPVKMNFFGAISISLLLLAVLYYEFNTGLSLVVWVTGAMSQLILTLVLLSKIIWEKEFTIAQFNPTWIIPIVGNIVVPLAGAYHTGPFINWLFFSIGIVFTLIYLTLLINRIFFHPKFPPKLTPTFFIILAPLGVGFVSYIKLVGEVDTFAYIIYGLGFYLGLLLLYQIRRFISIPFFVSWWALLFPTASMTNATYYLYEATGEAFLKWIFIVQVIGLIVLSIYLLGKTINLALKKKLAIEEA